jgi:glycosyltransferase involved in cell wall biosynthesis
MESLRLRSYELLNNPSLFESDRSPTLRIIISIWMFKPGTGGLQSHAEQLGRALVQSGHEVTVVTRAYSFVPHFRDYLFANEAVDDVSLDGLRVRSLKLRKEWRPVQWVLSKCIARQRLIPLGVRLYEMQAMQPMRKVYRDVDVIHHIGQATALIGFAAERAARLRRIPFLVEPTCHPLQAGDTPLDHRLFRRANRLLAHTKFEADHFRSLCYCVPIDVVGNGIEDRTDGNAERFRRQTGISGHIVLYIGRKDPDKGYELVVEAFRRLRSKMPDVSLVCIGPSGGRTVAGIERGFFDLGFVSEQMKHDALAACTCLCVPSIGESFGLVYMEAGRYAKPVVARRLPVLEELLENGLAGLLVGVSNTKRNTAEITAQELATSLCNVLNSPEECARLGQNCRRVSEKFVWPKVVKRFEAAYEAALGNDAKGITGVNASKNYSL